MIEGACHCGQVRWRFDAEPEAATACSCTFCRRYGALWAYGHDGEDVHVSGETRVYVWGDRMIGFHFCPNCSALAAWRGLEPNAEGRRRAAVNLRLAEPGDVAAIPVEHLDGLETWTEQPGVGRTVGDLWF